MERTELVQELQDGGGSVLCLGVPEGALFGIDYAAWVVGPQFMGAKLIPPGLHYIYSSPSGDDVGVARTGFFVSVPPRGVVVRRWDPESETLVRLDPEDEERYTDGVHDFAFDANLGPYRVELAPQWAELTRHASAQLVGKIGPAAGAWRSRSAEYDDDGPGQGSNAGCEGGEPRLEFNRGEGLFFSDVPRLRVPKGASPQEVTQMHTDRSGQLEDMIATSYGGEELQILGEMQIAFIVFALGQNYDGFEQWKALLTLLCSCEEAVVRRPALFAELLRVLFAQITQAPSDMFSDELLQGNFVGTCTLALVEVCAGEATSSTVKRRCGKLQELLEKKFGLSLEDLALLHEDAPQVIDAEGIFESSDPTTRRSDPEQLMDMD